MDVADMASVLAGPTEHRVQIFVSHLELFALLNICFFPPQNERASGSSIQQLMLQSIHRQPVFTITNRSKSRQSHSVTFEPFVHEELQQKCSNWRVFRAVDSEPTETHQSATSVIQLTSVWLHFRPPADCSRLCWSSERLAVCFVHAVVALVTANAYFSTLGGGHFLCKHLDEAAMLARAQMAVSMGLQDPILESKCRINLAYNAMQAGRFRRARQILRNEQQVAERLHSAELRKVCHAAQVYCQRSHSLYKQLLRQLPQHDDDRQKKCVHDNFYRQRIVRKKIRF